MTGQLSASSSRILLSGIAISPNINTVQEVCDTLLSNDRAATPNQSTSRPREALRLISKMMNACAADDAPSLPWRVILISLDGEAARFIYRPRVHYSMKYGVQITTTQDGGWSASQLVQRKTNGEYTRTNPNKTVFFDHEDPAASQKLLEAIRRALRGKLGKKAVAKS